MTLRYATGPETGCDDPPSDLALDRLHIGALAADEAARVQGHLDGCPDCAARFARVAKGFDAFPELDERRVLAAARAERRPRWWIAGAVVALAAAALVFALRPEGAGPVVPGVRTKGAAALRVFRQPAGSKAAAEEALSGSIFAAGDRVRFVVDLPSPGAVTIYGREGDGAPYVAWPRGDEDVRRPEGKGLMLPNASAALDDAPGPETLYLVHCPGAERVAPCAASADGLACDPQCTVSAFVIRKGSQR